MRANRLGLSTLEAMVAITVLGVTLVPILDLQTQIARTHARYQVLYERTTLQRNALQVLRDMNPMDTPEGEVDLQDGVLLRWRATPISEQVRSTAYSIGDGPFDVTLYRINVEIVRETPPLNLAFDVERVGWRRIDQLDPATSFASPTRTPQIGDPDFIP